MPVTHDQKPKKPGRPKKISQGAWDNLQTVRVPKEGEDGKTDIESYEDRGFKILSEDRKFAGRNQVLMGRSKIAERLENKRHHKVGLERVQRQNAIPVGAVVKEGKEEESFSEPKIEVGEPFAIGETAEGTLDMSEYRDV